MIIISFGLNFINVLSAAFTCADPKSEKDNDDLTVFFTLLVSTSSKAACKMLMKLTPGLNFINVLRTAFTPVAPKSVRIQSSCQYLFTLFECTSTKASCKMLMKLTPGDPKVSTHEPKLDRCTLIEKQ